MHVMRKTSHTVIGLRPSFMFKAPAKLNFFHIFYPSKHKLQTGQSRSHREALGDYRTSKFILKKTETLALCEINE